MTDVATLLAKLRDPAADGAGTRLAEVLVADAMERTIGELVDVRFAAAALKDAVRAFAASDAAEARVARAMADGEKVLAAQKRPVGAAVPAALKKGARELAAVPQTPSRDVVFRLLDREPVKKLLRAQVIDTLVAFGRKAASPVADNPLARGLGGLGKLAMGQASKQGAFGALASAVSGEVERQVEKRATDFADTAVCGDPRRPRRPGVRSGARQGSRRRCARRSSTASSSSRGPRWSRLVEGRSRSASSSRGERWPPPSGRRTRSSSATWRRSRRRCLPRKRIWNVWATCIAGRGATRGRCGARHGGGGSTCLRIRRW